MTVSGRESRVRSVQLNQVAFDVGGIGELGRRQLFGNNIDARPAQFGHGSERDIHARVEGDLRDLSANGKERCRGFRHVLHRRDDCALGWMHHDDPIPGFDFFVNLVERQLHTFIARE